MGLRQGIRMIFTSWRLAVRLVTLGLSVSLLAVRVQLADAAGAPDYPIANGHFYTQANGQGGGSGQPGFGITDDGGIGFWTFFSQQGGVAALGYPISTRFLMGNFTDQAVQRDILQWDGSNVSPVNVLDVLHDAGLDSMLQAQYFTPPPADTSPDFGLAFPLVRARHIAFLAGDPAIQAAYFGVPDPEARYGLPMSRPTSEANGAVVVVRLQRAVLQHWLVAEPWAAANQVTVANAGDIAKAAGLLPASALAPQAPPPVSVVVPYSVTAATSDNWSGYVAATDASGGEPDSVTDVMAQWTVPSVDCSVVPDGSVGVWIGFDGVFSPTVEQTGTASVCSQGRASYYAWIEIYPASARTSAMTIQPGDNVSAEVGYLGALRYQLTLRDLTTGQGFSVVRFSPGSRDSAEWVVEAPSNGERIVPLASFGSVTFSNATATIAGHSGGVGDPNWATAGITMVNTTNQPRAVPSTLAATGTGFQVTWQRP